jgi:nicotinamidase/pyrazinamidase
VTENDNRRAIIVVDPQPDFFEGGALPVAGATRTAQRIADFLHSRGDDFALRVVTQDWHVDPGGHWSDEPNFETTWPVHCVANTSGAAIHASLVDQPWDVRIRKGQHEGAYSGFEGSSDEGTTLFDVLTSAGITSVAVVGFATDHCVRATALDARRLGFDVNVILDLCAGVDVDTTRDAIETMTSADVAITESNDV